MTQGVQHDGGGASLIGQDGASDRGPGGALLPLIVVALELALTALELYLLSLPPF